MSRPRIPYLHKETARGKTFWYYRRGHGPRVRLRSEYGTKQFLQSYHEAMGMGAGGPSGGTDSEGTFAGLWRLYRDSPARSRLSPATQKQRLNLIRPALARAGDQPLERWDRKF